MAAIVEGLLSVLAPAHTMYGPMHAWHVAVAILRGPHACLIMSWCQSARCLQQSSFAGHCSFLRPWHVPQVGLNGVDNGAIRFSGVRVPRENLLDRFGSVDSSGQYRSPYSASRRFAATLGELTGGRVGLTCSSLGILKVMVLPSTV